MIIIIIIIIITCFEILNLTIVTHNVTTYFQQKKIISHDINFLKGILYYWYVIGNLLDKWKVFHFLLMSPKCQQGKRNLLLTCHVMNVKILSAVFCPYVYVTWYYKAAVRAESCNKSINCVLYYYLEVNCRLKVWNFFFNSLSVILQSTFLVKHNLHKIIS